MDAQPCPSCGLVGCIAPDVDEINWDMGDHQKKVTRAQWGELKHRPLKHVGSGATEKARNNDR